MDHILDKFVATPADGIEIIDEELLGVIFDKIVVSLSNLEEMGTVQNGINRQQFEAAITASPYLHLSPEEINLLFSVLDSESTGSISREEFIQKLQDPSTQTSPKPTDDSPQDSLEIKQARIVQDFLGQAREMMGKTIGSNSARLSITKGVVAPSYDYSNLHSALSNIMVDFAEERQQRRGTLVSELQQMAEENEHFAKQDRADKWTPREVCYWIISIGMESYSRSFYTHQIDGSILLNDLDEQTLSHDLGVNRIHCAKIMRSIEELKTGIRDTGAPSDEITHLRHSLVDLEEQLKTQKEINTKLREAHELEIEEFRRTVSSPSLTHETSETTPTIEEYNDRVSSANRANGELRRTLQTKIDRLEMELREKDVIIQKLEKEKSGAKSDLMRSQRKIRDLESSYVTLEEHYNNQLAQQEDITRDLADQMRRMSRSTGQILPGGHPSVLMRPRSSTASPQTLEERIEYLWAENETLQAELENEKESKSIVESETQQLRLELIQEREKRKILENQTMRLTEEITRVLQNAGGLSAIWSAMTSDGKASVSPAIGPRVPQVGPPPPMAVDEEAPRSGISDVFRRVSVSSRNIVRNIASRRNNPPANQTGAGP